MLIYSGIRSSGKRKEKGEEKEEGRKKSLIRIITATIIGANRTGLRSTNRHARRSHELS